MMSVERTILEQRDQCIFACVPEVCIHQLSACYSQSMSGSTTGLQCVFLYFSKCQALVVSHGERKYFFVSFSCIIQSTSHKCDLLPREDLLMTSHFIILLTYTNCVFPVRGVWSCWIQGITRFKGYRLPLTNIEHKLICAHVSRHMCTHTQRVNPSSQTCFHL